MLDIKFIRENQEIVKNNIKKKLQNEKLPLVDNLLNMDAKWRKIKADADLLRAERNKISGQINNAKKEKKDVLASSLIKRAKALPEELKKIEAEETTLEADIKAILNKIPNIISKETPMGRDASENKEIKRRGKIPKFTFPVKTHVQIAESLGIADFEASARVSGNGFYYLKNDLAILNQALIRFAIDFMLKQGYEYIEPPLMLNERSIYASVD